jgi:hypothetical protein
MRVDAPTVVEALSQDMEFVAHGLSAVLPHWTLLHHLWMLEPLLFVGVFQLELFELGCVCDLVPLR